MNHQDLKISLDSLVNYYFCNYINEFTMDELTHLCTVLDYPHIEDRYLCDYEELYQFIQWDKLEKMQAIRIVTRQPKLLNKIDLKRYEYRIKEVMYFIQSDYTRLFKYFNFDFNNLPVEDAYFLLCLGKDEILNLIDVKKYKFGFIETFDIIKAYNFRRDIIMKMDYTILKNYQVAKIIINTGEEFLDLFNLEILNTLDWLELLSYRPEFIDKCDFDKFIYGDPFNLIELVTMFQTPDLTYLIDKIDIDRVTALGWEKLLIYKTEKAAEICDFSKLKENNWVEILQANPELIKYKIN